jgi:nucleoside-diphosphate-sugar epimerase
MTLAVSLMDVSRARAELGWEPVRPVEEAVLELFAGLREGAGDATRP